MEILLFLAGFTLFAALRPRFPRPEELSPSVIGLAVREQRQGGPGAASLRSSCPHGQLYRLRPKSDKQTVHWLAQIGHTGHKFAPSGPFPGSPYEFIHRARKTRSQVRKGLAEFAKCRAVAPAAVPQPGPCATAPATPPYPPCPTVTRTLILILSGHLDRPYPTPAPCVFHLGFSLANAGAARWYH